jgi:hypothetical protein
LKEREDEKADIEDEKRLFYLAFLDHLRNILILFFRRRIL